MKNKIIKFLPWVILAATLIALIPGLSLRIKNEKKNNNVVMAVLYNDIRNKVSEEKRNEFIRELKEAGIDTVAVMEEDINMLVSAGEVTSIKYNVLQHKYDDESMLIGEAIKLKCPNVSSDSHIIIAKRPEAKAKLAYHLPRRYGSDDYAYVGNAKQLIEELGLATDIDSGHYMDMDMDIYVLYDGHKELWHYAIGYDEQEIKFLTDNKYKVSLIFKVKNYANTAYLEDLNRVIKDNNVEYLNLKEDATLMNPDNENTRNYEVLADIILANDMTLVVTENTDQLSNQKFFGYEYVFNKIMKTPEGTHKVLRSYETYDDSQADETIYGHRVSQHFNSTVDRNIRFVTITQITNTKASYSTLADHTYNAATEYKDKITNEGFTVGGETQRLDYIDNGRLNYSLCAVVMVMAILLMIRFVFGNDFTKLTVASVIVAALGFAGTFILYNRLYSLISLYPTVYCVILSSFAMTVLLAFIKAFKEKLNTYILILSSLAITVLTILIGTVGMGTMLSGIDYYVNNSIFRGIKLSLLVPIVYTAIVYYLMFMQNKNENLLKKCVSVLNAQIRVYWLILGGIVLAVGAYYIIRSGNVNSISGVEQKLRTTLTNLFSARPRTKEFLIGYPALVLLVYYAKNINIKLVEWILAIAASILAASVTNSFCHVFTDYSVIVSRTINGLIVGLVVSVFAYVANLVLVYIVKKVKKQIDDSEMN